MKLTIRSLLLCLLMLPVITTTASGQYVLNGQLTGRGGAPVRDAVIIAGRSTDSSMIKTSISDTDGHYSLTLPFTGSVFIKVAASGYEEQTLPLDPDRQEHTLNFILIPEKKQLAAITVSARKPLLERKTDRTIFNVSASITTTGGNAVDAIRKAPGVLVKESDNSISLAGKGGTQVMVDGRLAAFSGEDLIAYLQAIPADNIDRIEVITTPPAQYDAAGNSGLINIVLKKNRRGGFNGDLRMGYEQATYGTGIGGGNLNYRKGKLNIYGNGSYSAGAKGNVERLNTYYTDQALLLEDPYKKQVSNLLYTVGADYELQQNSTLGVQLNSIIFNRRDAPNTNIYAIDRNTARLDSMIHTGGSTSTEQYTHTLNLNYVWTIDTAGRKLTINANRLWYDGDRNRAYETTNYYGIFQAPTGTYSKNKNTGSQAITITTAQIDAELPFKRASLSAGAKFSLITNNSHNDFLYFANGTYYNEPSISNAFDYREAVQALYISAQKTIYKWSIQAGLRGEMTQTQGYSRSLSQTNTSRYFNLFPTAYLSYTPGEAHVFNINYSKRINRPGYADLDPFRLYSSPYSYIEGNPFLKPAYNHNIELSYTLKGNYTFNAFYQLEQDHFGQVFYADAATKSTYTSRANLGNFVNYGVYAGASFTPAKWWNVQLNIAGSMQQISTGIYNTGEHSYGLPTMYAAASNSFTLNKGKTLLAEVNGYYLSRYQQDLFYYHGIASVDTGIKAVLLDKQLTVSLNASDIFASQVTRGTNQVTGQVLDSYFDQRNVRLMLNYKLGNGKVKAQRQRSTGMEDESRRM